MSEGAARYFEDLRLISHFPSQCTSCGLCELGCPLVQNGSAPDFVGPMRLVASGMRGGPVLFAAESSFKTMSSKQCIDCGACEKACPESIPMIKLSKFYLRQIDEINAARK